MEDASLELCSEGRTNITCGRTGCGEREKGRNHTESLETSAHIAEKSDHSQDGKDFCLQWGTSC